jgi:hypothetical protein
MELIELNLANNFTVLDWGVKIQKKIGPILAFKVSKNVCVCF